MLLVWADTFITATLMQRAEAPAWYSRWPKDGRWRLAGVRAGRRSVERRVARALRDLDDHRLADIGLTREEAEAMALTGRVLDRA